MSSVSCENSRLTFSSSSGYTIPPQCGVLRRTSSRWFEQSSAYQFRSSGVCRMQSVWRIVCTSVLLPEPALPTISTLPQRGKLSV